MRILRYTVENFKKIRFIDVEPGAIWTIFTGKNSQGKTSALDGLAAFLRGSVVDGVGRVYAGGLLKFEPGEMQRLPVPGPQLLAACAGPVISSRGTTCGAARTCRE